MAPSSNYSQCSGLGLDVGERRVGVAIANLGVRFARPLTTLEIPETFYADIIDLCDREDVVWIVIGLPRGLEGQDTAQTDWARAFGAELTRQMSKTGTLLPVYWIDEALTSRQAETELAERGRSYARAEVDALAATYILEDFLREHLSDAAVTDRSLCKTGENNG